MTTREKQFSAKVVIGAAVEGSFRKNTGVVKAGLTNVGGEIRKITKRQKELARQSKTLKAQGADVSLLEREYDQLGDTLAKLTKQQKRWENVAAKGAKVGKTFGNMTNTVGRYSRNLAIGAGAAGAAIFGLANSTASLGDDVAKRADKIGIGIEALQELQYSAERSGVSTGSLNSSVERFVKRIGEAVQGTGAAKNAYAQLGLSAEQLASMQPDEALGVVADKMSDVEDQSKRVALAAAIFGREGIGMVNMLKDGSKGLDQLRQDARDTGNVLSEEAARDAEAFKDALLDAEFSMKGMKNTIGAALMPAVTGMMKQFSGYMTKNRDKVIEFADRFATGFKEAVPVIGKAVTELGSLAVTIGKGVNTVANLVGGFDNLGIIIGGIFAVKAIVAVGSFVSALWSFGSAVMAVGGVLPVVAGGIKAIGLALMANPIGLIVGGIAIAAGLVIKYWDPISDFFSSIWESPFEAAKSFFGWIYNSFTGVGRIVGGIKSLFGMEGDEGAASPAGVAPAANLPAIRGAANENGAVNTVTNAPVYHITQQPGQNARDLAEEIERIKREQQNAALFDTAEGYGP